MKKSKWLFNIITVVLCVCAMAIGVYAAKQASLTANGQIGFKAHNCEVILNGTIDAYQSGGDTVLDKTVDIATNKTTGGKITNVKIGGTDGVSTLTLPAMYFSDTGTNGNTVTLNLTTANQSVFDVKAKISVTGDMPTGVTFAISTEEYIMGAKDSTTDEKSFTITFTLSSPTTATDFADTAFKVIMEFEKYVAPNARDYLQRATTANTYTGLEVGSVYVEMGQVSASDTTPLKWYAFAYSEDGTDANMTTFGTKNNCLVDEITETTVPKGTYYFISEYVFNITSRFNKKADGTDPAQVDYNGSVLQTAIEGLKTDDTYKLYDSEIFNLITDRNLPGETYSTDHENAGITSGSTGQKFWPLSFNETDEGELGLLSAHGSSTDYSNCETCTVGSMIINSWWLRSPYECYSGDEYSSAYYVYENGSCDDGFVNDEYWLRPAFQLVIS